MLRKFGGIVFRHTLQNAFDKMPLASSVIFSFAEGTRTPFFFTWLCMSRCRNDCAQNGLTDRRLQTESPCACCPQSFAESRGVCRSLPVKALSMYSRTMRKLLRSAKARHSANCPSMDCSFCAWELKRAYMTAFFIEVAPLGAGCALNLFSVFAYVLNRLNQ